MLLSLCMMASMLPVPAAADAVTLDVSKGLIEITATGYKAAGAASETAYTGDYVITGTSTGAVKYVTVSGGTHTITLRDVNIDFSNGPLPGDASYRNAFSIESGAAVNLVLSGDSNTLKSSFYGAALRVPEGASLTVSGDGTLNTYGRNYGAAIGGGSSGAAGTIRIEGGTVTADNHGSGAAIGSSSDGGKTGSVTITGGIVKATGTDGAGIGGYSTFYSGGSLTVTGGYVKATSTNNCGIGGGKGTAVVIDGGIVDAALAQNDTLKNSADDTLNTTRTTASITGIAGDTVPTAITYTKSDGTAVSYGCKGATVALLGTPGIYLPEGATLTGATAAEKDCTGSFASGSGGTLGIKDPTVVWNDDNLALGGSTGAETYRFGNADAIPYAGKITLKTDGAVNSANSLIIENGGYVIFDHVNHMNTTAAPSLYVTSNPTLELKGDNTLGTFSGDCITVYINHTLTIKGTGSLTLNSGSSPEEYGTRGTLIIESGTLHANREVTVGAVKIGGGQYRRQFLRTAGERERPFGAGV